MCAAFSARLVSRESEETEDKLSLRGELQQELQGADADALREALEALKKGSSG